jgi:hypothetical protein
MMSNKVFSKGQLLWFNISSALRYFLVSAIASISAVPSDVISSHTTTVANIVMCLVILTLKTGDRFVTGVNPEDLGEAAAQDRPE